MKYDTKYSKSISTPTVWNVLIDKNERGVEIDITKYRGITTSLLYLILSRLVIMFCVCMSDRFQASPWESNFKIVKEFWGILTEPSITFF